MSTPKITVPVNMVAIVVPRAQWPKFQPSAKPSVQSPFKTILQFGESGSTNTVRIIVEGRDQAQVDAYAKQISDY